MEMRKAIITTVLISITAIAAQGEYTLKISNCKYPEGVKTENLNGNLPDETWYKRSWTEDGWSIGDYSTSKNVAVSPSHVADGICENALTLPSITIEEGEWLRWEACEGYPIFNDSYTVEFRPDGNEIWTKLGEFTEEKSSWSVHMIDLSEYQGITGEIRFVCRSEAGYLLVLNNISVKKPTEHTFALTNKTPKFFATGELEDGNAQTDLSIMNTGAPMQGVNIVITVDGETVSSLQEDDYWPTGETRHFQLPLPLTPNVRTDYKISIELADEEKQMIGESFAYCTSFKRHLYVDKGTGMWCNQCPTGTLVIEELEETYGDALIVGETHEGDLLANDNYFKWLQFYGIPHVMLNHIQSTKGESTSKFENQICIPTEMGINITSLSIKSDGTLSASASVSTSESFTATDRTYRIGYVLTRNVSGHEDPRYYQKNICTLAKDKQYRYLPSRMTFPMCYFPNVTIPSQLETTSESPAFTGVAGSLPETLAAEETYNSEWDIPLTEGYDNFDGIRLVAFIIDAGNRYIINSTAASIDDYSGIEEIPESIQESSPERIFTIDGRQVRSGRTLLQPGLYIIDGKKVMIK
ncbi:MAG: hypothetical protein K2K75_04185 [Muribaculaceae bacterium]|nr:hypothetical protein [Muribaculaceae bacterium]